MNQPKIIGNTTPDVALASPHERMVIRDGANLLGNLTLGRNPKASELIPVRDSLLLHAAYKEMSALQMNYTQNTARLQIIWEWLQTINKTTGIEPPNNFFDWFDDDGKPKVFDV